MSKAQIRTDRIVQAARNLVATPNDMAVRTAFVRATFNHDWLAEALVLLSAGRGEPDPDDPQPSDLCRREGGCVCGGDLARVRAGCSWWSGE